jgi:putative component of membrane protein insertase Oxa1/YidC/SpoIIIJ protein YidD
MSTKSDAHEHQHALHTDEGWKPPSTPVRGAPAPRILTRPRFSLIACALDYLAPLALLLVLRDVMQVEVPLFVLIGGYVLVRLKQVIIWGILAYQRFAPEQIRRACVFEPSCSEYTLRALERYGLIPGLTKGISRLLRCHDPNGGVDEP